MADWIDKDYEAAMERGRVAQATDFHATGVRYDREQDRVFVDLVDDCAFSFPARLIEDLRDAAADLIAEVEISPTGVGLRWETLDVDYSVEGLLNRRFGSRAYMLARAERAREKGQAPVE